MPALQGFHIVTKFHGPGCNTGSRVSAALKLINHLARVRQLGSPPEQAENYAAAAAKLIARHWPEPTPGTDEWRDWQLTVPRSCRQLWPRSDVYWHWVACGAWQFSCGAAWLVQQREAMGRPFNATMEAAL